MTMKMCAECLRELPLSQFSIRRASKDGLCANCKDCRRVHSAEWRAGHPVRVKANRARWHAENRDAEAAYGARWNVEHPGNTWARKARSRALRFNTPIGFVPDDIKTQLLAFYGPVCMRPGCESTDLTADHIVPLSKGGAHAIFNLQLLCAACNSRKGNRSSADYRQGRMLQEQVIG